MMPKRTGRLLWPLPSLRRAEGGASPSSRPSVQPVRVTSQTSSFTASFSMTKRPPNFDNHFCPWPRENASLQPLIFAVTIAALVAALVVLERVLG